MLKLLALVALGLAPHFYVHADKWAGLWQQFLMEAF
jgi:hypothetical protein